MYSIVAGAAVAAAVFVPNLRADEKDDVIRRLEERLIRIEARLAALEAKAPSDGANAEAKAADANREAQRNKARERMAADRKKHSPEELREAEQLYQVANKDWKSAAARESLQKMIAKFPDVDRTGCAILYLAQMSEGPDREKHLRDAIDKYGDCYYGDGVQVGAFARVLLATDYLQQKQPEKAAPLLDQLRKDYPTAIDHSGRLLSAQLPPAGGGATTQKTE